eukprot:gene4052-4336_t
MSSSEETKIVIVGAGFSGLCMAMQLQRNFIHDFIIIEKSNQVGGTWWENKYPGAECDVESHLYSFSFEPNPHWTRVFSGSDEIQQYLHNCAIKYNLFSKIHFEEVVLENFWTGEHWIVSTNKSKFKCQFLVFSSSPLHYASIPDIPGIQSFTGKILHTSKWDRSFDFQGKRVGMIGCGASGIQAVPFLQQQSAELIVHQRTPQWIMGKGNRDFTSIEKFLFRVFPFIGLLYRSILFYYHEFLFNIFYKNSLLAWLAQLFITSSIKKKITNKSLREKLIPNYPIGCKRILLSDDFYQHLNKTNVTVIVQDPIDRITKDSMIINGKDYKIDVLVLATGFDITGGINAVKIFDRKSKSQSDTKSITSQYYGIYIKDTKNFFTLLGYNSASTYTSVILYIEAQVNHIIEVLKYMNKEDKKTMKINAQTFDEFNNSVQERSKLLVIDQCKSWYLRDGKNISLYPDTAAKFNETLLGINLEEIFIFE